MFDYTDTRKKIERYAIVFLVCISLGYGAFRVYPLLAGPSIVLYSPKDGDTVASTTFEVSGRVSRVKEITVQGRSIPIGTDGNFAELLVAQKPYSIVVISATDFYGKTITKTFRVIPE
jgi:hypothetical protein